MTGLKTTKRRVLTMVAVMTIALPVRPAFAATATSADLESCLLSSINAARAADGAGAVEMATDLVDEVRAFSATMSAEGQLRHMTSAERTPILPSDTTTWGENVAWTSQSNLDNCAVIHNMLMNSAGHRANIENGAFDYVALGVHIGGNGTWVTQLFFAAPGYAPAGGGPIDFAGTFADDDNSVFQDDIEKLAASGITKGCGETSFCPTSVVTRGQMAAFLVRALDLPAAPSAGFGDAVGHLFEADIDALAGAGITSGCGGGNYCPDAPLKRASMAAFLVRALDLPDAPSAGFTDTVGSPFEKHIDSIAAAGITMGCNPPANTKFCPNGSVDRGQMAAFLVRALGL